MASALVIGFGPFPGAARNPSAEIARRLAARRRPALAGVRVASATLPTVYAALDRELPSLLRRHDPDALLLVGLATHAPRVRIETRAVNAALPLHPDAARARPQRKLATGAPEALTVRAPAVRLLAAVRATGVPARLSRDAGRYLCNATLFACLDTARRTSRPRRVAFIHIPAPRRRAPAGARPRQPAPELAALVRACEAALIALLADARNG